MKNQAISEPVVIRRLRDGQRVWLADHEGNKLGYFYAVGRVEVAIPAGLRLIVDSECAYTQR